MYLFPGAYKNFDDLEEHLTREELIKMWETAKDSKFKEMKFLATLQGLDIDEGKQDNDLEEVRRRAALRVHGENEENVELDGYLQVLDEDGE